VLHQAVRLMNVEIFPLRRGNRAIESLSPRIEELNFAIDPIPRQKPAPPVVRMAI
jgi:hypothetical protein